MNARVQQARAEIARRRALAEGALTTVDDQLLPIKPPTPWHEAHEATRRLQTSQRRGEHIAANDPAHVLGVLADAEATLDRHARTHDCQPRWLDDEDAAMPDAATGRYLWPLLVCADAAAVLDLYAPEVAS